MVRMIEYPDDKANLDEWRVMIQDLEIFTGGLLLIEVENVNTAGVPRILENSRLDINGSKYCVRLSPEDIGGSAVSGKQNYIYALANGDTASFSYSDEEPQWDPAKGGWYNGNNRAIVKLFFTNGQYNNKVILDSYNAMSIVKTGLINLSLTDMDTSAEPQIAGGSVVEVDGAVFEIPSAVGISPKPTVNTLADYYIYAAKSGNGISFEYSSAKPAWDQSRMGWYSGAKRAVAKGFGNGTLFYGKVILDSFSAIETIRADLIPTGSTTGITLPSVGVYNKISKDTFGTGYILLEPGVYFYDIKGASGGGGTGNNPGEGNHPGDNVKGYLVWPGGRLEYGVGEKGGPGGKDDQAGGGGGGGGCSYIGPVIAHGGKPGNGYYRSTGGSAGYRGQRGQPAGGIYAGNGGVGLQGFSTLDGVPLPPDGSTDGHAKLWRCW